MTQDQMATLADRCKEVGWGVTPGPRGYAIRPPGTRPFTIPKKVTDKAAYQRHEARVLHHGLEEAEKKLAPKKTAARKAKIQQDREKNDARLAAAERAAAAVPVQLPTAAPAPVAPAGEPIDTTEFTPAAALQRLGLGILTEPGSNGNGHAPRSADPVDAMFPGQVIPDELRGAAGLSSLEPDMDLSEVIIDPADAPPVGPSQVTVYQLITPEIADEWLRREIGILPNGAMLGPRPIRPGRITKYTGILNRDLVAQREGRPGEWDVAEDLKLAPFPPRNTGGALNGRHRLWTIRESGIKAIVKVTYNTAPRLYRSLDQGGMRSTQDNLGARGYKNVSHVGSTGKLLWCWTEWRKDPLGPYHNWRNWPRVMPTDAQLIPFLDDLLDPVTGDNLVELHRKPGANMMAGVDGVPAAGIAFRVLVTQAWAEANPDGSRTLPEKGREVLDKFCEGIQHGWNMTYGNPADTVRKWIDGGSGGVRRSEKREWQLNGLLRALGPFVRGVTYKKVQVPEDGPMPLPYIPSLRTPSGRKFFGLHPRD